VHQVFFFQDKTYTSCRFYIIYMHKNRLWAEAWESIACVER